MVIYYYSCSCKTNFWNISFSFFDLKVKMKYERISVEKSKNFEINEKHDKEKDEWKI